MNELLTTQQVCRLLGVTEPALRHILRRSDAPRPPLHPTARVFLWTRADVSRLISFLGEEVPE